MPTECSSCEREIYGSEAELGVCDACIKEGRYE